MRVCGVHGFASLKARPIASFILQPRLPKRLGVELRQVASFGEATIAGSSTARASPIASYVCRAVDHWLWLDDDDLTPGATKFVASFFRARNRMAALALTPVVSGRRPVVKGRFEDTVSVSGAVMSSASHDGSSVNSYSADADPR